jgi:hypothetical protein
VISPVPLQGKGERRKKIEVCHTKPIRIRVTILPVIMSIISKGPKIFCFHGHKMG